MIFSQKSRHLSVPAAAGDEQRRHEHKEEKETPQGHGKQLAEPKHPPPHKYRHQEVHRLDARWKGVVT